MLFLQKKVRKNEKNVCFSYYIMKKCRIAVLAIFLIIQWKKAPKRRFSYYLVKKCRFGNFLNYPMEKSAKTAFFILSYGKMPFRQFSQFSNEKQSAETAVFILSYGKTQFWQLFQLSNGKKAPKWHFFILSYWKMSFWQFSQFSNEKKAPKRRFPYYLMGNAILATFFNYPMEKKRRNGVTKMTFIHINL